MIIVFDTMWIKTERFISTTSLKVQTRHKKLQLNLIILLVIRNIVWCATKPSFFPYLVLLSYLYASLNM